MSSKSTIMELQLDTSAVQEGVNETAAILAGLQQIAAGVGDTITQAFMPIAISLQKVQESMESLPDTLSTVTEKLNEIVRIMQEGQGGDVLSILFGGIQTVGSLKATKELVGSIGTTLANAIKNFGGLSGIFSSLSLGWVAAIAAVIAILAILVTNWDSSTEGLQQSFTEFKDGLLATWQYIYDNIIGPIISVCGETLSTLWDNHLKPLWDNIVGLVMTLAEGVLSLWNDVLKPVLDWIIVVLAPIITNAVNIIVGAISVVVAFVSDIVGAVVTCLDGLIQFIVGVFTGDWKRVWSGIVKIFEGIWEGLGGIVKGIINVAILAINTFVAAIYTCVAFVVNGLGNIVGAIGNMLGKNWGFSIPTAAPQIPYLAQGAVLPANKPFLAVVGDQKHGTNIEAPLATIQQALADVLAQQGNDIHIRFTGDLAQLGRVLKPVIDRENRRVGGSLAKGAV